MYLNSNEDNFYTVTTDKYVFIHYYNEQGATSDSIYSQANKSCALDYIKNNAMNETTCSDEELTSLKENRDIFNTFFEEIKTDSEHLLDYLIWYQKENK